MHTFRHFAPRLLRQLVLAMLVLSVLAPTGSRVLAAAGMLGNGQMVCTSSGMKWVNLDAVRAAASDGVVALADGDAQDDGPSGVADADCPLCLLALRGGFLIPAVVTEPLPVAWQSQYPQATFPTVAAPVLPQGVYQQTPPLRAPPPVA